MARQSIRHNHTIHPDRPTDAAARTRYISRRHSPYRSRRCSAGFPVPFATVHCDGSDQYRLRASGMRRLGGDLRRRIRLKRRMAGGDAPSPETSVVLGATEAGKFVHWRLNCGYRVVKPSPPRPPRQTLRATAFGVRPSISPARHLFFFGSWEQPRTGTTHTPAPAAIPGPGYLDWRTVCG